MNRTGREVTGRGSCTSCLWLTSTSYEESFLAAPPHSSGSSLPSGVDGPIPRGPTIQANGNQVTVIGRWLQEVTGKGHWGSSTMLIINSKDTFSLNSCPVVIQQPQASLALFSPLSCCQPSEVFSGRGKAQPYNLPAQKQSWHKCTWPANWKRWILSECEANLDPYYLRHTTLSVRGSGVGCREGSVEEVGGGVHIFFSLKILKIGVTQFE